MSHPVTSGSASLTACSCSRYLARRPRSVVTSTPSTMTSQPAVSVPTVSGVTPALQTVTRADGLMARTRSAATSALLRPTSAIVAFCRRSEEHTSELQSQSNLVCRLLLEKKKELTSGRLLSSDTSSMGLHLKPQSVPLLSHYDILMRGLILTLDLCDRIVNEASVSPTGGL